MFDFLSDEVFQIVVITALFVIGLMLFMLYRRPSTDVEKLTQFMDDIDYRLDKMNKKLDELTNTFVNGLIVDDDDASSVSSGSSKSSKSSKSSVSSKSNGSNGSNGSIGSSKSSKSSKSNGSNALNVAKSSLNYEGIEFSDIPNFSTDTSVLDEDELDKTQQTETSDGKKRATIVKRIIQTEE
jgi:hypothetical protein